MMAATSRTATPCPPWLGGGVLAGGGFSPERPCAFCHSAWVGMMYPFLLTNSQCSCLRLLVRCKGEEHEPDPGACQKRRSEHPVKSHHQVIQHDCRASAFPDNESRQGQPEPQHTRDRGDHDERQNCPRLTNCGVTDVDDGVDEHEAVRRKNQQESKYVGKNLLDLVE